MTDFKINRRSQVDPQQVPKYVRYTISCVSACMSDMAQRVTENLGKQQLAWMAMKVTYVPHGDELMEQPLYELMRLLLL